MWQDRLWREPSKRSPRRFTSTTSRRLGGAPVAHEAFTGRTPGVGDIEAWIFLADEGVVKPGMIINFQNELGQSINERSAGELVGAGYQISVVPYVWWSHYLFSADSTSLPSGGGRAKAS